MFHFFEKKKFLVDYLENFVDIHNHILPGIDDGAKTVEDALVLIKEFSNLGITNFIATPHIMHNYYPNSPMRINTAFAHLKDALLKHNFNDVTIAAAAEHMIDDNFENLLEIKEVMPIRKDYLLIEMSYLQPPINFDSAIIKTASNSFYPILAHPERYSFLHTSSKKYSQYKSQGILFQLNILSLSNFYGKEVLKKASKMLDEGLIDFVATDVHNLQQLEAIKELKISQKNLRLLLPIINKTIETFY